MINNWHEYVSAFIYQQRNLEKRCLDVHWCVQNVGRSKSPIERRVDKLWYIHMVQYCT